MKVTPPMERPVCKGFAHSTWTHLLGFLLALCPLLFASSALAVTRQEAVDRAQQWVDAGMPYCQCPNHGYDKLGLCTRPDNPAWDAYRSDCSGLVSWAWDLGAPGLVTGTLWNVATIINAADLKPGDALNSADHVMLFAGWVQYPTVASLIDEHNWGSNATHWNADVSINGSSVVRADWPSNPFTAIRYNAIQESCPAHCEGSTLVSSDCGKGDCAAFGSSCVDDDLGARCVFALCPAKGDAVVCLPNSNLLGACSNGQLTTGDCGAFGAICSASNGPARCVAPYAADFVDQGSSAPADPDGKAYYRVCAGADVDGWFELRNQGWVPWSDVGDLDPKAYGKAIRLGTSDATHKDFADPFTMSGRVSIASDDNPDVHFDGADCSDHAGCARTKVAWKGKAPTEPGIYTSSWQLVDEARTWFGPVMFLTYDVVACAPPAGGGVGGGGGDGLSNQTTTSAGGSTLLAPSGTTSSGCSIGRTADGGSVPIKLSALAVSVAVALGRRRRPTIARRQR